MYFLNVIRRELHCAKDISFLFVLLPLMMLSIVFITVAGGCIDHDPRRKQMSHQGRPPLRLDRQESTLLVYHKPSFFGLFVFLSGGFVLLSLPSVSDFH